MAIDLLSKENIERLLTQKQLAVWNYLQKVDSATPREISEQTKVAYPTVRQAIDKLMRLKRLSASGKAVQRATENYKPMQKEIANKIKEETYYKCTHCGDEIFGIPIKNLLIASARKCGLMVVRIMSGLLATKGITRKF